MNYIPPKFCINFKKITQEQKTWFKNQIDNSFNGNSYGNVNETIYHFQNMKSLDTGEVTPNSGYTLISFEDFEKIMIESNSEPTYEIY